MLNHSRYARPNRIVVLVLLLTLITLNLVALNTSGVSAAEGDLDATFGTGDASVPAGVARAFFGANPSAANDTAKRVAIQSTGKIVATGRTNFQFALARYNGTLDTGFGSSGKVTEAQFDPGGDSLNDMAVDSNDRIITIGLASGLGSCSSGLSSPADWAIAVYTANGILDTTFNLTGKRTIDFFGCSDSANAVVVQPDNKIVIIGTATEPVSGGNLVRYVVLVRLLEGKHPRMAELERP